VERPAEGADITSIPIGRGFLCLVAIMDWHSRAVLAWRLSNSMDGSFCVSALEEALARFGKPDILNTDRPGFVSFPGSIGRLGHQAVRFCLADACDPRRA
jgi:putative transposase